MIRVITIILFLLVLPTFAARSADLQISVAEIISYGIFETHSAVRRSGFSRSTVAADNVTGVKFTDFTKTIPGKLGTNFGFQYSINTRPRGQKLQIRSVIRFPEPGVQKPGGKLYRESVEKTEIIIGEHSLHGFGFDEPWEIVPGDWEFEVWYKKARLIRKTFTVVAEEGS
ncbi:MAG: DUF3859 domain-containing protein [Gammaproteobacteria bacterium]|nr:DUF3859 domain-containing protein [Gammaproteobacteria bacterium]MBT7370466.1 DUF3859 domain-containing protein [Gammaproteobacteria bacterium]